MSDTTKGGYDYYMSQFWVQSDKENVSNSKINKYSETTTRSYK